MSEANQQTVGMRDRLHDGSAAEQGPNLEVQNLIGSIREQEAQSAQLADDLDKRGLTNHGLDCW